MDKKTKDNFIKAIELMYEDKTSTLSDFISFNNLTELVKSKDYRNEEDMTIISETSKVITNLLKKHGGKPKILNARFTAFMKDIFLKTGL